jgi:predicted unusual protein kinase regulating ubiquinone biosynthesis (AarF/ABC1/UbiB family)
VAFLYTPRRFVAVLVRFLPLVWTFARDRRRFLLFGPPRVPGPTGQRRRAERLLDTLLTLGPTFIKLGQLLSTRPDVLPPIYVEVLSRLQDRVPPAEWADARTVLEDELGPVDEVFDDFDTEAISGASLGQVYTATCDGQKVAVKVRRPGVEELVETDLRVIRWTLPVVLFFVDDARSFSLSNLADEFEKTIREEMDYRREAAMLREIRGNFLDDDGVVMPSVVDHVSGDRVLTMEYIGGTKITDVDRLAELDVDRTELAERLVRAYLKMLVEDGVFHADPHPGNLAVGDDGTLVFYDFGMSGRVQDEVRQGIVDFYIAAAERDVEAIIDLMQQWGALSPNVDRGLMEEVLELAIRDARGEAVEQYRVQRIVQQVEDTMYEFPVRLPRDLALVLRVATVVEGVCVTLDEEFDFVEVATDFLGERGYREEGARRVAESVGEDFRAAAVSSLRVPPKLERTLDRIDRDNLRVEAAVADPARHVDRLGRRIAYSILLSASALATAWLYARTTPLEAAVPAAFGVVVAVLLARSLRRRRNLGPQPQFTRQGLRQQRGTAGRDDEE